MPLRVNSELERLTAVLQREQQADGSWRYCFESGPLTDAYAIILLRTLNIPNEPLISGLAKRIASRQAPDGTWKLYPDERDGNLSATIESYFALLAAGAAAPSDERLQAARRFIRAKGGLAQANLGTRVMLALTGQHPWPPFPIPAEFMLVPPFFPLHLFDLVGFARVHLVPIMVAAARTFAVRPRQMPDLSDLSRGLPSAGPEQPDLIWFHELIDSGIRSLPSFLRPARELGLREAERFLLDRLEPDGTLYSFFTATFLMIFALLALGYRPDHPVIIRAVRGIERLVCPVGDVLHMQNSTSTIWDTALLSHALQTAGMPVSHSVIQQATRYLLSRQHNRYGDWARRSPGVPPGGWGFSDINTINPDVDDTTAALRALHRAGSGDPAIRQAWDRGLRWLLSMQNSDGGWPAFERNTANPLVKLLPAGGAEAAFTDPSTADLTGRTLEFLGNHAGMTLQHPAVRRGVDWLLRHQEANGSWHGRWGISYLYGTWAALSGLIAAGVSPDHPAIQKGVSWLRSVQNRDGGWGESCQSDVLKRYVPLGASTPSQTAWAVDALTAVSRKPGPELEAGVRFLLAAGKRRDWTLSYPTGAALPGGFYIHYHSYRYIWPLLALAQYRNKFQP
ncbi:squalene--hopene cyclase [Brevibacillus thermoruber]|uniref:squalene--hopene cyclase n=1 Tax=Brevibacillus thermoruber TaxID=33942 RepID=UPI004041AF09